MTRPAVLSRWGVFRFHQPSVIFLRCCLELPLVLGYRRLVDVVEDLAEIEVLRPEHTRTPKCGCPENASLAQIAKAALPNAALIAACFFELSELCSRRDVCS